MPPNNAMSTWGNEKTMNLNTLVLTNIQSSPYFKVNLFELKTYHEVIDEIYYKVGHLEPWEKGSRKTAGQTGMCGGVRGVGAGGIVSSAFCLLYKLFTLKLTKKQVIGLITHNDSPYIRGLGFMYIRYTQPPADLWPWFEEYLDDDEEIDVKAGGGHVMTIGEMLRQWLVKLEWYATLFPRIPVPIEKDLAIKLKSRPPVIYNAEPPQPPPQHIPDSQLSFGEAERRGNHRDNGRGDGGRSLDSRGGRGHSPGNVRSSPGQRYQRSSSPAHHRSSNSRRSPPPRRTPPRSSARSNSFERDLAREKERQKRATDWDRDGQGRGKRSGSPRDRLERKSRSRSPHDRALRKSRSTSRDRKKHDQRGGGDRKDRRSRSRDRDRHEASNHKRSHKEKKDRHRDRDSKRERDRDWDEKAHKSHKSRTKDRDRR